MSDVIRDAIAHRVSDDGDGKVMVSAYLVVAEVVGDDGQPWVKTVDMDGMTDWAAYGLASALHMLTGDQLRSGWSADE